MPRATIAQRGEDLVDLRLEQTQHLRPQLGLRGECVGGHPQREPQADDLLLDAVM